MSKRNVFGSGFPLLHDGTRLPIYDPMGSLFNARVPHYNFVLNNMAYNYGYLDHFEDLTDDDDDDDDSYYSRQNNGYCGFAENFLDKRFSKQLSPITHYKTVKGITPEEAAKNAKELVAEEEKLKKKAEKKKQKKMRQRERRRVEKLEKENGSKNGSKLNAAAVPDKSTPTESENKKKTNNSVPPDPGPKYSLIATESSDSDDDDDDDDKESIVEELELDMSSCFVTNAAAIAKRKLEQKPKPDRKDKNPENVKKPVTTQKSTTVPSNKSLDEKEASEEPVKDNVNKSMELAVIGNRYAQTGNLDLAVKYFTDAIKHNPQEVKLFGNRSFCYEKMQHYENALLDAEIALSLDPTWIKGLYRKGKALVGLKRYYDAGLTYKEVLKIDSSCTDAAQELIRVQIMQLMDMGYSREQSSNALIIHGTVEKALEALSGLHAASRVHFEEVRVSAERNPQPIILPLRTVPQNPPKVSPAILATQELFPVWVGDLVPAISKAKLHELFGIFGTVHSVSILSGKRCAFINYTNKEDCEKAIKKMHGFCVDGTCLVVRYPKRIHTHLGVSKTATTDAGKVNKFPDECYFWRTTGCVKTTRCSYRHVPEHKGIDGPKVK